MNNLLSFLLPNGDVLPFGDIKDSDHNVVFEEHAKFFLEEKNVKSRYKSDEMFFTKAIGLAAFDNVVSICNCTNYKTNSICDSIIIYSPDFLTDLQKDIMVQFYNECLVNVKNVTIAVIDSEGNFKSYSLDDYNSNYLSKLNVIKK